jgi:hypothetical protein
MSFDDAEASFRLRQELQNVALENVEDVPVGDGVFGDERLVGRGQRTSEKCGRFGSFYGCDRTDLHDKISLDGVNYKGKVFVRTYFHSCDKPSCPICFKRGWAVREAHKIEVRLAEASKRWGKIEHIVTTLPPKYYSLSRAGLRAKAIEILFARSVVGGCMIFHGFRFNLRHTWYWSPHFHVLGFILGGYKCRSCEKICFKGCGGFIDRSYRCFEKDGCVVKVMDERKTVGGTAWYQLNHASYSIVGKRANVVSWFGVCSYRKLKVTVERRKTLCPICQHDLVKLRYFGSKAHILAWLCSKSSDGVLDSFEDLVEDGRAVWVVDTGKRSFE